MSNPGLKGALILALGLLLSHGAAASTVTTMVFDGQISVVDPSDASTASDAVSATSPAPLPDYMVSTDVFKELIADPASPPDDLFATGHVEGVAHHGATPEVNGQPFEFGRAVNGQGIHSVSGVTTLSQRFTNDSGTRQAINLDILIRAGKLAVKDLTTFDGTSGAAYLGIEISADNGVNSGVLGAGTLLASKNAGPAAVTTLRNGLFDGLNMLQLGEDPGTGTTFTWADTSFTFDLGELSDGQSIDILYRMVSAGTASGFPCYSSASMLGCPATLVSFDDPGGGTVHALRSSTVAFPAPVAEPPAFLPLPPVFEGLPLPRAPLVGRLPPPTGVPAPATFGFVLLGLSGALLARSRTEQRQAS